ncbi:MAG: Phosphoesterase PHP domain protein [Candidatus Woesebacteria bacterium GW2011_GWB1_38_5b]|uniref:Phosphoesterase PHP domain protein n=1 Tax=Candidatus Woesebacteria bacterium GW2011_GWB1_38_5b TaxID=1618569 RepID=A0A0G0KA59_9BACT|nr:MAG: Phosphoesterase PHP domain protein [Candidatus Woesebacteria bacterium GW2011_GWB1_38_5b]
MRIKIYVITFYLISLLAAFLTGQKHSNNSIPVVIDAETSSAWVKGAIHVHSLWSDGNYFPEAVADLYKQLGYNFVAFAEHDTLQSGDKYIKTTEVPKQAISANTQKFGADSITYTEQGEIKLKGMDEYRGLVENNDFILMQGEEISNQKTIHTLAININKQIPAILEGFDGVNVVKENYRQFNESLDPEVKSMFVVAHPNSNPLIIPEEIGEIDGGLFMEIYNGHPLISNEGGPTKQPLERMWDVVLFKRLSRGAENVFGIAADDAHHYYSLTRADAIPGRGYVRVKLNGNKLSTNNVVDAMIKGDFYSSTGVELFDIKKENNKLEIKIEQKTPVSNYKTIFIGTKKGVEFNKIPVYNGNKIVAYKYSDTIGGILKVDTSLNPSYEFTGEEIYVRAKIIASDIKNNPKNVNEFEVAWTQAFLP